MRPVRTLHTALRVSDLTASLAFYTALGYEQVGRVSPQAGTTLVMLKLSDDPAITLELVHRPGDGPVHQGASISHRAVQVDDLDATVTLLHRAGLVPGTVQHPAGEHGPSTCWLVDPDGYRIELVSWPPGHPDGMTCADFT